MQFAILAPSGVPHSADPVWMARFAQLAEATGFESLVAVEHAVVVSTYTSVYPYAPSGRMPLPDDGVIPDPLELLAFLAACTTTLRLATGVLVLPVHHPVVLAKRLATIDRLSAGRLRLCVGVGWMREELEACGVEFETRGRRADEAIDVLRMLWADHGADGVSHRGEFFAFANAHSYPKPVQANGIPIHVGGHSAAAARRAGRRGDGFQPLGVFGPELAALLDEMRRAADAAGRDPGALEVTLGGAVATMTPEKAAKAAAAGAHRILCVAPDTSDLGELHDVLHDFASRMGLELPAQSSAPSPS